MIVGLTRISEECFSFNVNVSASIKLHWQFGWHFGTRRALGHSQQYILIRHLGTRALEALYLADSKSFIKWCDTTDIRKYNTRWLHTARKHPRCINCKKSKTITKARWIICSNWRWKGYIITSLQKKRP